MIPDWMIEEIKKSKNAQYENRPQLEIPIYPQNQQQKNDENEVPRGVVIIQIWDNQQS
jgi:hypothetical protein